MRRPFVILLLSVAFNACLVALLLKPWGSRQHLTNPIKGHNQSVRVPGDQVIKAPRIHQVTQSQWDTLYSDDVITYAANLRAAGCPESSVGAIVQAKLYVMREEQFAAVRPPPFWSSGKQRQEAVVRAFEQRKAITQEIDALAWKAARLRWIEEPPDGDDFVVGDAVFEFITGHSGSDGFDSILAMFQREDRMRTEINGLPPVRAMKETAELEAWARAAMATVYSTAEQAEAARRRAAMIFMDSNMREGFALSGAELETVSRLVVERVPAFAPGTLQLGFESIDMQPELRDSCEIILAEAIGPQRHAELLMSRDPDFEALHRAANDESLQVDAARRFYEIKKTAQSAWASLFTENLTEAERLARLGQIRSAARQALESGLPEALLKVAKARRLPWAYEERSEK